LKFLAIVNPVSGSRRATGMLREVVTRLGRAGHAMTVCVTRAAGDAEREAGTAPSDTDAILAVGGDGTVREVVDGLVAAGRRVPVGILATGTENLLARDLGMPEDPAGLVRMLLGARSVACDVGVVNGRHFLAVCGVGFDAEVVDRLANGRRGHITHMDYFWPVWRTFWEHRFPRVRVRADGREVFAGQGLVFVGVIARYSAGLRICRRAKRDDGMLDLCIYPCTGRGTLLGHAVSTLLRRHDRNGRTIYLKCREVQVEGNPSVPVEMDGDPGGRLPVEVRVLPGAAGFLRPADGNGLAVPVP